MKSVEVKHHGDKSTFMVINSRPDSYLEDIETNKNLETDKEKEDMWSELKAGAQSGMDHEIRWFIKNSSNDGK